MKTKNFYKLINKILIIFLIFSFAFSMRFSYATSLPQELSENDTGLELYAEGCVLLNADNKKVLYNKNGNERLYPASVTKIVTALLVLEKCNFNDMVNVSYYAVNSVPATYTTINLVPGESLSVKDLIHVLMIASANDAAFVLAEYIANNGNNYLLDSSAETKNKFDESIKTFADMMNSKAKEIGCMNSNFVNPNGIHNENHYSTAYDMALIGCYAYKNADLMSIVGEMSYSLPNTEFYTGDIRTCKSTNALLNKSGKYYFPYANGLKTGYTDPAGYCIVASCKKDDLNLIAVILNAKVSSYTQTEENKNTTREADCIRLFNYGFDCYEYKNLISAGSVATTVKIINGQSDSKSLDLIVKDELSALVQKDEMIDITPKITISKFLAPISEGEVIGKITYSYDGKTYSSDLIASHDVSSSSYANFVIALLVVFIVLLILVIIMNKKKKNK